MKLYDGDAGDEDTIPLLPPSRGLQDMEAERLLADHGRNELFQSSTPRWLIFMRCLWGPMPLAIWVAIVIQLSLENWTESGILLTVQLVNALVAWVETCKASNAVKRLQSAVRPTAIAFRDGMWQTIDAALIVPGDLVKLGAGSIVPADCTINDGTIDVDEAALTGESLPVTMGPEQMPKMGSMVVRGEVDGTVQFTGQRTFFGKTTLLLDAVEADLGNLHYILGRVMVVLTFLTLILGLIGLGYQMGHYKLPFRASIQYIVSFVVVSIPVGLEVVVTTTLALGSDRLSRRHVVVTRLAAIEMLASVNMLCCDKTGTLTLNRMEIQEECHVFSKEYNRENVLVFAALASRWREPPRDALDTMVLDAADLEECDKYTQLDFLPFDPRIKRTEATLRGPDGLVFKTTKGAPNVVLQLVHNREGIRDEVERIIGDLGRRGVRCLTVARTKEDNQWHMAGILTFLDPPRADTRETIRRCQEYGVDVKMITGDHQLIAKEMARMLDMDTNIMTPEGLPKFPSSGDPSDVPMTLGDTHGDMMIACGGFAHVYPEHKYVIVETLRQRGYTVAFAGDGVNDAPSLKRADVGIAVEGSTEAARAAADAVLLQPGLSAMVDAILIARGVFQQILAFMTYRIALSLHLALFFFVAVLALPMEHYWRDSTPVAYHFFRLPLLMMTLLVVANDAALLALGYDTQAPMARPQRWCLSAVFTSAAIMAAVVCASSLLLLWMCLDSSVAGDTSWLLRLGIPPVSHAQIPTIMFLQLTVSSTLMLLSSRTGPHFFWAHAPSAATLLWVAAVLATATVAAVLWPESSPNQIPTVGLYYGNTLAHRLLPLWVWMYAVGWWFVQDLLKVLLHMFLFHFDVYGYRAMTEAPWRPSSKTAITRRARGQSFGATDNVEHSLLSY